MSLSYVLFRDVVILANVNFDFQNSVFTYMVSPNRLDIFDHFSLFSKNNYYINYTKNTVCYCNNENDKQIAVIGFCIDSHGEISRENVPNYLLENSNDIDTVINLSIRLAGKYIILFENHDGMYAITDAASSVPLFYCDNKDEIFLASTDTLIGNYLKLKPSEECIKMRLSSELFLAFPNDITMFDEIKVLLPNHYLNCTEKTVKRYYPNNKYHSFVDLNQVLDKTYFLVNNILNEYKKYYDIILPLSGGWDSRLNLAFFLHNFPIDTKCFTFIHNYDAKHIDLEMPNLICKNLDINHEAIQDLFAPPEYIHQVKEYIGDYQSKYILDLAYTINAYYKDKAIINGDIIGQIGKSSIGRSFHYLFSTPLFFTARQPFYSKHYLKETKKYITALKREGHTKDIYDLFAWENRCGRSLSNMIYGICNISSLNLFNCHEIIEMWLKIPRKLRNKKIIHKNLFAKLFPRLVEYPFETTHKPNWFVNSNFFLIAFYVKFYLKWIKKKIVKN